MVVRHSKQRDEEDERENELDPQGSVPSQAEETPCESS